MPTAIDACIHKPAHGIWGSRVGGDRGGSTLLMFFRNPLKEEALMQPMNSKVKYCSRSRCQCVV